MWLRAQARSLREASAGMYVSRNSIISGEMDRISRSATTGGDEAIGLGFSSDGITWTGYDADGDGKADPVFNGTYVSGDWDYNYVSRATIIKNADEFNNSELLIVASATTQHLNKNGDPLTYYEIAK